MFAGAGDGRVFIVNLAPQPITSLAAGAAAGVATAAGVGSGEWNVFRAHQYVAGAAVLFSLFQPAVFCCVFLIRFCLLACVQT